MRRPRRGRRPKGRTSIVQSPAQLTAQSTAPCSAQRGAKTVAGFRARKTDTVQSSPQFSASCQPHCGSAVAPPVPLGTRKMARSTSKRRPLGFHLDFAVAKRVKSLFRRAGDGFRGEIGFFARSSLSARLGKSCQNVQAHFDDFPPKAGRASLATGGYCPRAGQAPRARGGQMAASTPIQRGQTRPLFSIPHTTMAPPLPIIRKPKQNRITGQETAYFLRFNRYG